MQDWTKEVNAFLTNNRRKVLEDAEKVSHEKAITKAYDTYDLFRLNKIKNIFLILIKTWRKILKVNNREDSL